MPRRKSEKAAGNAKSWKDIEQDVKAKSISETAFKRIFLSRCRYAALCLAALLGLAAAARLFLMNEDLSVALTKAGRSLPIKSIVVESDALSRDWILAYLGLDTEGANLLGFDLKALKSELERHPQTQSVEVARQLPDTLFISVNEREPIAKLLAEDPHRGRITLLVDSSGFVYEGIGYNVKRIQSLPNLDGVRLKRKGKGFEPLHGMEDVAALLNIASEIAPHLRQSWKVVSLAALPKIVVRSAFAREVVFERGESDFRKQLSELDYVVDYYKSHGYNKIASVDLTMNSQVPVRHSRAARTN